MKVACVGYRDWALSIYSRLEEATEHAFIHISSKDDYDLGKIEIFEPDIVLFYGWSWYVEESLLEKYTCLMLHPSPLPRYRGGSPLQNQIIAGETVSKVSIFIMNGEMDSGPIVAQEELDLTGNLADIFQRIENIGFALTIDLLENGLNPVPQDDSAATYCVRRKPSESELTIDELQNSPAVYLHNKIRMLQDPYPNAFIKTRDGKKLIIKSAEIEA